jgi:hypothetical protein
MDTVDMNQDMEQDMTLAIVSDTVDALFCHRTVIPKYSAVLSQRTWLSARCRILRGEFTSTSW